MKIVNVNPGILPIPPNGWGAVEKIIWEQHLNLQKLGHDSVISYLRDVPRDADIVHIHMANLALEAHQQGIPYYFTMHDHHTVLYGKNTTVYKINLEAMKHAVRAFVPAKYLVDYFEGIPMYVSHGVNSEYFNPGKISMSGTVKYITKTVQSHSLLCVANNGYILDHSADRKGFSFAINAAKQLNLPITIAGPSNNKKYFEKNPINYDKLTILYDINEEELLKLYRQHSIFVSPSELEAGHPNLTLLEAMSCGLPVVSTFESVDIPKGMVLVERTNESVVRGIQEVLQKYDYYSFLARKQAEELDWNNITQTMVTVYQKTKSQQTSTLGKELLTQYTSTVMLKKQPRKPAVTEPTLRFMNIDGMFVEIVGGPTDAQYKVSFIDKRTNTEVYGVTMSTNSWAKTSIRYYVDWKVIVQEIKSSRTYEYNLDLTGKRVYIALESKSIGDTLAWFAYVDEFRKKHNCEVICSTFWNDWFKNEYPEITFVNPGDEVQDIFAKYDVGLFYDDNKIDFNKHPSNPVPYALQKYATDILGLDYIERKPKIKEPVVSKEKQVTIGIHSTAQTKYWNNPTGWQEVVDWLRSKGYTVRLLSKEENGYMGNTHPNGVLHTQNPSIETTMTELKKSEFFIGIGSGLTWLSWALNVPTVLISGFSDPITEMQECIRISAPPRVCANCWNRHIFDRGDWNWCPDFKNTQRQFECTKLITGQMVIDALEKHLVKSNLPKIQVKHLLTQPTDPREIVSIHSIKQLQQYGMNYEQRINEVYDAQAPSDFCARPMDIANTPKQFTNNPGLGTLTGRHYGCYLAHRNAIMSMDDQYDYTLIFEADAYITTSMEEFVNTVYKACETAERDGVYYISFAHNHSIEMRQVDDMFDITSYQQDLAHCYLIVNRHKSWWMDRINDCPWDVADLWFNRVFYAHPQKRYTTRKVYSRQAEGMSLIDKIIKS